MTLYGYADNSPPGTGIAHPCIHLAAGGTGTYSDPVTFATDVNEEPWCAVIYVPYMHRYFIHEDECSECDADWNASHLYRFDMWAGGDALSRAQPERKALLRCESTWTRGNSPTDPANPSILVDPPPNLPVTTDPIFSPPGTCWQPVGIDDPGTQTTVLGSGPVSLQIRATDSNSGAILVYGATGLPAGLSIDAATGLVSGAPALRQRARVTVVASDGLDSASVSFRWNVKAAPRR
jgi:Putative Ig domain